MKLVFQRVMAVLYAILAGLWGYLLIGSGMTADYAATFTTVFLLLTSGLVVGLAVWLLLFSFKKHAPLWAKIVSMVWLCVNGGLVIIIPSQCYALTVYSIFHDRIVSGNYNEYMAFPFTATFFTILSLLTVVSVAVNMQKKRATAKNLKLRAVF